MLVMANYELKVIANQNSSEEISCTISCKSDIFYSNMREISNIATHFRGTVVNNNTIIVPSTLALMSLTNKLLTLTMPVKLSKNKR